MDLEAAKKLTPEEIVNAFRLLESRLNTRNSIIEKENFRMLPRLARIQDSRNRFRRKISLLIGSRECCLDLAQSAEVGSRSNLTYSFGLREWRWKFQKFHLPPKTSVKSHERKRRETPTFVDDHSQLRFGDKATIIDIEIPNPDIVSIAESQLVTISEKSVYKLVQLSSPFVGVRFIRKVVSRSASDGHL